MQIAVILGRLTKRAAVLAPLVAASCFSPELESCLRCDGGGSCPEGQSCEDSWCVKPAQSAADCRAMAVADEPGGVDILIESSECGGPGGLQVAGADVQRVCTGGELDIELRVQGGAPPYRWYLAEPVEGLMLAHDGSSAVARLRGALAEAGLRRIVARVESVDPDCAPGELVLELDVHETPRIVGEPPAPCAAQTDYLARLEASGGDAATYRWSVSGLPDGLAHEAGEIYSLASGAVVTREPVELTLSLEDASCGPVEQRVRWPANFDRQCFTIQPPELAASCAGIEYRAELAGSVGAAGQTWELLADPPAGLTFDAATGTLSGVPEAGGELHVRLTASDGRVAERRYELPLRDSCRFAYVSQSDGALHLRDVFLSSNTDVVLPATLGAGEAVFDFQFSPDGEWLALRAGVPDQLRVYLARASTAAPSATLVELECPDASDVCGVIDYAWAPSSRALALVVRGDLAGTRDYLTGVDVDAPEAAWPMLAQDTELALPLVHGGELSWVDESHVALIAVDPFNPAGQQVPFVGTLASASRRFERGATLFTVTAGQLGLLPAPGGFVTFGGVGAGVDYTPLESTEPASIIAAADQRGPWLAPSRERAARVTSDGRLQILALDGSLLHETPPSVCGVVVAWSSLPNGGERLVCGAVDAQSNAVSADLTVIDYSSASRQQGLAFIPELEVGVLAGTRRVLAPSGNGFVFTMGDQLVLVDTSQPQPITSTRTMTLSGIIDLQYAGDGRLILQSSNELALLNTGRPPTRRTLAGPLESPSAARAAVACQEDYALSPFRWCGAASVPGAFAVSNDAHTILFEDDSAGLWIADVHAEAAPRQVTSDLAPCSGIVRAAWTKPCYRPYAFQP